MTASGAAAMRSGKREIPVEFRPVSTTIDGPVRAAGSLVRVELEAGRARSALRVRVTRQSDHLLGTADWNGAQVARRAARLEAFDEMPFLAEALDRTGHDRVFERALDRAVRLMHPDAEAELGKPLKVRTGTGARDGGIAVTRQERRAGGAADGRGRRGRRAARRSWWPTARRRPRGSRRTCWWRGWRGPSASGAWRTWRSPAARPAKGLYAALREPSRSLALDWGRVHAWIGDDRFVPLVHPDSNGGLALRELAGDGTGILPAANLHLVPVEAAMNAGTGPDGAAAAYADEILGLVPSSSGVPQLDVVLLGVGGDGHLLSVFPGSAALDAEAPLAMGIPAPTHIQPHLPRVTFSPAILRLAGHVMPIAAGAGKAAIRARSSGAERDPSRWPGPAGGPRQRDLGDGPGCRRGAAHG